MSHHFPEEDSHMFVEREAMLLEADALEEMRDILEAEEAEEAEDEGILSYEDAEKLINDYIRSDWSASRMDQIPY